MEAKTTTIDAVPMPVPAPSSTTTRDWSELPREALLLVFTKLDLFDILMGAGLVCHSWLDTAKVPSLWCCVDMASPKVVEQKYSSGETGVLCAMARLAVDRSGGQLQEFSARSFVSPDLIYYVGDRAPSLKILRLTYCHLGREAFAKAINKFPLLEELDLTHSTRVGNRMVAYDTIGKACPHLKIFRQVNEPTAFEDMFYFEYAEGDSTRVDAESLAIASMTELRTLQLRRSKISNGGLIAILDGCPHLESIDVRQCSFLKEDNTMEARLACLKSVRLPWDPTEYNQQVIKMPGESRLYSSICWSKFLGSFQDFKFDEDDSDLEESIVSADDDQ